MSNVVSNTSKVQIEVCSCLTPSTKRHALGGGMWHSWIACAPHISDAAQLMDALASAGVRITFPAGLLILALLPSAMCAAASAGVKNVDIDLPSKKFTVRGDVTPAAVKDAVQVRRAALRCLVG
jgi:hypothetical protein